MKHTSPLTRFVAVVALLFFTQNLHAKNFYPAAVVPGVSVGYIFEAGISLGAEINYTPFVFHSTFGKTATGMYAGINYFHSKGEIYKETWYHTFACGAIAYSDSHFIFKLGATKTVLRWGRDGMNKKKSKRISPE